MQKNNNASDSHKEDAVSDRLQFAFDASGMGTWAIYPQKNEIDWDERCMELSGFSLGETVTYSTAGKYIHPDDVANVRDAMIVAFESTGTGRYETRFRTTSSSTGKQRWVLSKGKAYFTPSGEAYLVAGIVQDITDEVQRNEKIIATEQMAQLALDNSRSGYFHLLLANNRMEYSAGYSRIVTGLEVTEFHREDFIKHLHPDDLPARAAALAEAEKTGVLEYESRVIWVDGTIHWVKAKGSYINDTAGKPYLLTGTIQDITDEHNRKEAIKEAEDVLASAFNTASVGIAFTDLYGRFLNANKAYSDILGLAGDELVNAMHSELAHPDDRSKFIKLFRSLASGTFRHFNQAQRYIHKDGSVRWVQTNATRIGAGKAENDRVLIVSRDTTAEMTQAQALSASQAMFRNVTNSAPTGLWLSDPEGGLTYLNKTLVEWTGMPYETLLGAGWASAIIDEDRTASAVTFLTAVAHRAHYDAMFRMRKGDGSIIWCRAAGDPYYHRDGRYAGYAGFCMDIDELVAGRQTITASEKKFRSIVEQAPMAIALLSGRDMVIEVGNDKIFEIWGKDSSIAGKRLIDGLPEIKDQGFMQLLESVYDTGEPVVGYGTLAKLVRHGILQDAYFDYVYTPLRDSAGHITGVMVLATDVTMQMLARKALEESEARFRNVIVEAPMATALYRGRNLNIEIANELMITYWGKDSGVINKQLHEAVPELAGQPFLQLLDDVYTTGIAYQTHEAMAKLEVDGVLQQFYFNFTYKPLRNQRGEVYAILNMAVDVTAQVRARMELEESELFSRSIIENSPIAKIVVTGAELQIRTINEKMLEMLDRDPGITGQPLLAAIPELTNKAMTERMKEVFLTGATHHQQEERVHLIKHNVLSTGYYNYIYKALRNTAGDIYGVMVTANEVTEQVLARQKIEEAETTLRGAIELAQLGTWQIDLKTGISTYSQRMCEWCGLAENETITRQKANACIRESDRLRVAEALRNATGEGSDGIYDVEYSVNAGLAGKERILHAQGKTLFHPSGEPYSITGTVQDVTTQRKIQLALEQKVKERTEELQLVNEELTATNEELNESNEHLIRSNEELAQYAYVASHDLQEPLRKIRIFSEMLEMQKNLPNENMLLIGKISQSAERMSLLIRDLLDFSRVLKSESLVRPVNITDIITAVANDFELTIKEKNVHITIGKMPVIEATNLQMNQLFYNLLSNALKFTRPGITPQIEIASHQMTVAETEKYISRPLPSTVYHHITIKDNGIGFDVKFAEQIFEVFKRLHGRGMYPGSGIGLALCRRIAGNHNGILFAKSEEGAGSEFHLILPEKQDTYQSALPEGFNWKNN